MDDKTLDAVLFVIATALVLGVFIGAFANALTSSVKIKHYNDERYVCINDTIFELKYYMTRGK